MSSTRRKHHRSTSPQSCRKRGDDNPARNRHLDSRHGTDPGAVWSPRTLGAEAAATWPGGRGRGVPVGGDVVTSNARIVAVSRLDQQLPDLTTPRDSRARAATEPFRKADRESPALQNGSSRRLRCRASGRLHPPGQADGSLDSLRRLLRARIAPPLTEMFEHHRR